MTSHIDVTGVRLETERLILREWKTEDLSDFFAYASIPEVGEMAGWCPHRTMEHTVRVLSSLMEMRTYFAIELKETGRVIGSIGYQDFEDDPFDDNTEGIEVGFDLSRDYWGKGIIPEALKTLVDYSFQTLNLDYLGCWHYISNTQSRRVMEKCGFHYVRDILCKDAANVGTKAKLYILENTNKIIRKMSAPMNAASITLETQRLLLRPVNQNDLSDIHEIVSDPEVAATAGFPISKTIEDSVKRMLEYMDDNETLAVVLKENGKMIGTVSLQKRCWPMYPINRNLQGRELGFDLNRKYWGRGLMPEAVRAVMDHCFEKLSYDFLTAGYFLGNTKSERAIEKCGFDFLFESEYENPGLWKKMIRTHIQYNPHNTHS